MKSRKLSLTKLSLLRLHCFACDVTPSHRLELLSFGRATQAGPLDVSDSRTAGLSYLTVQVQEAREFPNAKLSAQPGQVHFRKRGAWEIHRAGEASGAAACPHLRLLKTMSKNTQHVE